jgi:hypothetical protein
MSLVKVQGNASGTGIFTIASPNSNTDRTLTLPDSSGTVATAESTLAQFNASGSAPVYAARAWVTFNGTGTVAINASGNVSSITDNGTGNYTVNFTTAMSDGNFAVSAITNSTTGDASRPVVAARTGSSSSTAVIQTVGTFNNNTNVDCSFVAVQIIR